MHSLSRFALLPILYAVAGAGAQASAPAMLSVSVEGILDGKRMPDANVVCLATPEGKSDKNGKNIRPAISWSNVPAGTHSFAIFVIDPDVPADKTDAGKEGKTLPVDAKREELYHYAVINIPAETTSFPGGASDIVPALGLQLPNDMSHNNYVPVTGQFGGPCPPWNDERVHHYHFIVLAFSEPTDTSKTPAASDNARAAYARLSTSPHLLAKGEVVGTYSLNPKMK